MCGTNAAGAPALASLHPGAGDRAPASPRRHDSILLHHGQLKRLTSFITKNVAEVVFFFFTKNTSDCRCSTLSSLDFEDDFSSPPV